MFQLLDEATPSALAGAGFPGGSRIIENQADHDRLWIRLGDGHETEQIAVDFGAEVILTYTHGE